MKWIAKSLNRACKKFKVIRVIILDMGRCNSPRVQWRNPLSQNNQSGGSLLVYLTIVFTMAIASCWYHHWPHWQGETRWLTPSGDIVNKQAWTFRYGTWTQVWYLDPLSIQTFCLGENNIKLETWLFDMMKFQLIIISNWPTSMS